MMNKEDKSKTRFCVQWDAHSKFLCTVLCSLMEHQSLVDLAICCGSNTIHAHKCILAANSLYFREQLEKNSTAEQVIINGLDFIIIKSIIEFIYCGETNISDENMKYMIAAAKFFQIRGLQALVMEQPELTEDQLFIPPPIFINKKPKYPTALRPFSNVNLMGHSMNKSFSSHSSHDPFGQRKMKRKHIRSEAERACAKEAAASRLALEALRKELATAPQVNSFVIEESCTETTVENFIPHGEENFIENMNDMQGVQVVNYADLNNAVYTPGGHIVNVDKSFASNPLLHYNISNNNQLQHEAPTEKIKHILGSDIPNNVEIMFKTSDGNFVSVTDEVLQNITKGALQYQVIDENGHASEIQELHVLDKAVMQSSSAGTGSRSEYTDSAASTVYDQTFSSYTSDESKLFLGSLNDTSGIASLEHSDNDRVREKDTIKIVEGPLLNLYANEGQYFNMKSGENCEDASVEDELKSLDDISNQQSMSESDCVIDLSHSQNINEDSTYSIELENKESLKEITEIVDPHTQAIEDLITETSEIDPEKCFQPAIIQDDEDDDMSEKRVKLNTESIAAGLQLEDNIEQITLDAVLDMSGGESSRRKTRSNFKINSSLENPDEDMDVIKRGKRILPSRKKK